MRKAHVLISTASLLVGLTWAPREALASKDYPTIVQTQWRMGRKPLPVPGSKGCMLCHKDEVGGKGSTTQPFGLTLRKRYGVSGGNPGSLRTALGRVQTDRTNSDADPVIDYTEIVVDGTNPNDARTFVQPPPVSPPLSEGGQGGEAGTTGVGGAAGESNSVIDGPLPASIPPVEDFPPPFTHGCALAPRTGKAVPALIALFGITLQLSARRARRRRRTR